MENIINIEREGNIILIKRMNHPRCVSKFIRVVGDVIQAGYKDISVHLECGNSAIFPNACVPLATVIDYYEQKKGIEFNYFLPQKDTIIKNTYFIEPRELTSKEIDELDSPMNKVLKFSDYNQVYSFTQKCIHYISQATTCEEGTIDGLIWCINEVMDNVTVHSKASYGYVMAQYHKQSNHIAICVADSGIGIYNSLKPTKHHPRMPIDAISLAVQEGIGDGKGQGNGLFGLYQIIRGNEGALTITSGPASIMVSKSGIESKFENLPSVSTSNPGTIVDFQMNLNKRVDLQAAFSTIGGHEDVDFEIESMMDDNDIIQYDVFEHCHGTATREAGRLLRNDVMNTIKRAKSPICLNFNSVTTVSSSFIDEFIAKMILSLGILRFNQIVSISNMNDNIKFLCERSIYMRIHDEWQEEKQRN